MFEYEINSPIHLMEKLNKSYESNTIKNSRESQSVSKALLTAAIK